MGIIEKKPRKLIKITDKFSVTPERYKEIIESGEKAKLKKGYVREFLENESLAPRPKEVARYVARTAAKIIMLNPTALVAVDKMGVLATRLVQHYIKRVTGKTHKVYIVKPGKRIGNLFLGNREPAKLLNPKQEQAFKKETRIAIIDDVAQQFHTITNVSQFVRDKTKLTHNDCFSFPLAVGNYDNVGILFSSDDSLTPTHTKKMQKHDHSKPYIKTERHRRFAAYLVYRDALDDYMTSFMIGKDTRVNTKTD